MADQATTIESTVPNADGPDDLKQLEQLIAADEAESAAEREAGKTGGTSTSANRGPRTGQRATPEVISAKDANAAAAGKPAKPPASAPPAAGDEKTPSNGPADGGPDDKTKADAADKTDKTDKTDDEKLSPFQKAKRREAEAWKKINDEKAQIELERKALDADRTKWAQEKARPAANGANRTSGTDANGYTPGQYLSFARKCEERAARLEAEGKYDEADQQTALATSARDAAREAGARETANANGTDRTNGTNGHESTEAELKRAWAVLRTDMPEALVKDSALNKALVEVIQKNGDLVNSPDGIFRAVFRAGKTMVAGLEREAARVPELVKQTTALQEKVKGLEAELQRLTSLPGGEALDRGSGGGKPFAELSSDERERVLEAQLGL